MFRNDVASRMVEEGSPDVDETAEVVKVGKSEELDDVVDTGVPEDVSETPLELPVSRIRLVLLDVSKTVVIPA